MKVVGMKLKTNLVLLIGLGEFSFSLFFFGQIRFCLEDAEEHGGM